MSRIDGGDGGGAISISGGGDGGATHDPVTLAADADTILELVGQQLQLDPQLANRLFAGPTSGGAADPTFRALVDADVPAGIMRDAEHTAIGDASPHHAAVTLAGAPNYITIAAQVITRALINLASHVTGVLPFANGGTSQSTRQAAINALTDVSPATDEHVLTKDTATGDATFKAAAGGGGGLTLSAKGDLHTRSASADVALAVGNNGRVLTADSAAATGNKWNEPLWGDHEGFL